MEIKWGIIPDMGITVTARHALRLDVVRELAYTGRIVDAPEALALGLVSAIVDDPIARAQQLAEEIAGRSPDAIRGIKRVLNEGWNASIADSLALEASIQSSLMGGENQLEAIKANLQKRPPKFID